MPFPQTAKVNLNPPTQGDSAGYRLEFTKGGNAVDISGWTVTFTAKRERGGPIALHTNASITDAANGKAKVVFSSSDTADLAGLYYYDIEVDTGSEVRTIMSGLIPFKQDVTE